MMMMMRRRRRTMMMIKDESGEALENCSTKRTTVINHMIPCNLWLQHGIPSQ